MHSAMHHYENSYIVKRLGYNEDNFRRREIRLVTVDECLFGEERHHARRDRRVLSTDRHFDGFNGPISILRRSFYCAVYTDLLSRNRFCEALRGICPRD